MLLVFTIGLLVRVKEKDSFLKSGSHGSISLTRPVKPLLVLPSHVCPIFHRCSWIWFLALPQHRLSLYISPGPSIFANCKLFHVSALQHLLEAFSLLKIVLVKFTPARPQKSRGENMACSCIHSVVSGGIWSMAEAAVCGWFLLARNAHRNEHRPDMFHFHSLIHLLIRQESTNHSTLVLQRVSALFQWDTLPMIV